MLLIGAFGDFQPIDINDRFAERGLPMNMPSLPYAMFQFAYSKHVRKMVFVSDESYFSVLDMDRWTCSVSPIAVPTGLGAMQFSPSGRKLAVASSGSGVRIYDSLTWALQETILTGITPTGLSWGPGDKRLAISLQGSPYIKVYDFEAGAFLSDPATLPAGAASSCSFGAKGDCLVVGHAGSPYVTAYDMSTFTKLSNPATLPSGTVSFVRCTALGTSVYAFDGSAAYIYSLPDFSFVTSGGPWQSWEHPYRAAFSNSGPMAWAYHGAVKIATWDWTSGYVYDVVFEFTDHPPCM
jgi:WD40 repeat protein